MKRSTEKKLHISFSRNLYRHFIYIIRKFTNVTRASIFTHSKVFDYLHEKLNSILQYS